MLPAYHLAKNSVVPGPVCTLQGVLINSGDVGSALFSFVIAIHTYLFFTRGARLRTKTIAESGKRHWILCFLLWFIVAFLGFIGIVLIEKIYPEKGSFCNIFPLTQANMM